MSVQKMIGAFLAVIVFLGVVISLLGMWGALPGDTAWQLVLSGGILGGGACCLSMVYESFFKEKAPPPTVPQLRSMMDTFQDAKSDQPRVEPPKRY